MSSARAIHLKIQSEAVLARGFVSPEKDDVWGKYKIYSTKGL